MDRGRRIPSFLTWTVFLALFSLSPAFAETVQYTYDDAGRLIGADYGNGQSIDYAYDAAGNLLSQTVATSGPPEPTAECFIGTAMEDEGEKL